MSTRCRRYLLGLAAGASFGLGGDCGPGPSTLDPRVVIDEPLAGAVGLNVTFRWHLDRASPGESYRFEVRLDKGVNACDGAIEQAYPAEIRDCLSLVLPAPIYGNQRVEFAVRATDSSGRVFCTAGPVLTVSAASPPAPSCGP